VKETVFYHEGGLASYVSLLTNSKQPLLVAGESTKRKKADMINAAKVDYLLSEDGRWGRARSEATSNATYYIYR